MDFLSLYCVVQFTLPHKIVPVSKHPTCFVIRHYLQDFGRLCLVLSRRGYEVVQRVGLRTEVARFTNTLNFVFFTSGLCVLQARGARARAHTHTQEP